MRRLVALAIPVITLGMLAGASVLGRSLEPLVWAPLSAAAATVGALLWHRRAGGVLGVLFVIIGLSTPLSEVASAYAHTASDRGLPGGPWAAWFFQASIAVSMLFFVILQLFPTGRPLSPRWRWLVWATVVDGIALIVVPAIGTTTLYQANFPGTDHPLQLVTQATADTWNNIASTASLLVFAASAAAIVVRYRRSTGDERAQMKWFATSAVVLVAGLLVGLIIFPDGPAIVFALLAPSIPIAAGIAILKYHLYDIDLVISKAVLFAMLAAFITTVYVLIVVGIGAITGTGSNHLLSIAATAIVAVLFQPIRERAQRLANRLVYGERATPYEVMAGFSARVADTVSTDAVLPQMAAAAGQGVGAVAATVRVALPDGTRREERWTPAADVRAGEPWTIEISYQGEPVGDLTVRKPTNEPLTPGEQRLLEDLGSQAGLALHNVRLTEELAIRLRELDEQAEALRVSRERLVTARDAQRRGLQRDIQEGAERQLLDIGRRLGAVEDPAALDPLIDRANDTLEELRDLARGIFPPLLADQGIVAALEAHIRKVGAHATVEVEPGLQRRRYDADVEACAYFCCLQAIQNVLRHADNAPTVVRLAIDGDALIFEVADAGQGFDVGRTEPGMGLQIIQDRVDAMDGSLQIRSGAAGTTVSGRIPLVLEGVGIAEARP